jgi:hypothetical protein
MSYKRKRMREIAEKYGESIDRVKQLTDHLSETYGVGNDWGSVDCPEMDEFIKLIDVTLEEIRDYFVVTKKVAQTYFFDALRLRDRGKI